VNPQSLLGGAEAAAHDARLAGVIVGVALLLFGARLYQIVVVGPGIVAGLALGSAIGPLLHLGGVGTAVLTGALAIGGALLFSRIERFAVATAGAVLAAAVAADGWPLVAHAPAPWWAVVAAGALGAFVVPPLYRWLLRPLTALGGALVLAHALGRETNLPLVLGLAVVGAAAQFALDGTKPGRAASPKAAPKKKG
jgi:hypothetical protein